ncbi:hypothetical protein J6590_020996 [Homalodisca vitripennis]|nr:hypothetical protein J6590_020996 [Homalodisca vitripennis]
MCQNAKTREELGSDLAQSSVPGPARYPPPAHRSAVPTDSIPLIRVAVTRLNVFKRHELSMHHMPSPPTPNIGFSKVM